MQLNLPINEPLPFRVLRKTSHRSEMFSLLDILFVMEISILVDMAQYLPFLYSSDHLRGLGSHSHLASPSPERSKGKNGYPTNSACQGARQRSKVPPVYVTVTVTESLGVNKP